MGEGFNGELPKASLKFLRKNRANSFPLVLLFSTLVDISSPQYRTGTIFVEFKPILVSTATTLVLPGNIFIEAGNLLVGSDTLLVGTVKILVGSAFTPIDFPAILEGSGHTLMSMVKIREKNRCGIACVAENAIFAGSCVAPPCDL